MNIIDLCFSDAMLRLHSNPYLSREWRGYMIGPDAPRCVDEKACASGVYLLFNDAGEVVYVGQSSYVGERVRQHRCIGREFATFAWVEVPDGLLLAVEAAYIDALRPPMNKDIPEPVFMQHDMMAHTLRELWKRSSYECATQRRSEATDAEMPEAK